MTAVGRFASFGFGECRHGLQVFGLAGSGIAGHAGLEVCIKSGPPQDFVHVSCKLASFRWAAV